MSDSGQRTEQASQRRLQKAREEGKFPSSRHFVSGAQMLVFAALLSAHGPQWLDSLAGMTRGIITLAFHTHSQVTVSELAGLARQISQDAFRSFGADLGWVVLAGIAAQMLLTQGGLALAKLRPDVSRLNPLPRLSGMPGQNWSSLCEALVLLPLFLMIAAFFVVESLPSFTGLMRLRPEAGVKEVASTSMSLLWRITGTLFVFGCFDFYRQRSRYQRDLRMTKQEVREEHKESEGNPQIKSRIRRLQRSAARMAMMKEVPRAAAVVVNPTHYAVALQYIPGESAAPKVVAKGKNYLAARIRELAEQNQVPIVENVPLAQALYKAVDIGQEIPPHLYRAVAEILAYIYRLSSTRPDGR